MAVKEANRSEAVRAYLQRHPNASSNEVMEALKAQDITVTASLVRGVRSKIRRRRPAVQPVVPTVAPTRVGAQEIKAAFVFLKAVGTVDVAKEALAAAADIEKIMFCGR